MSSQRVELTKEQWDLLQLAISECEIDGLDSSEKTKLKIIDAVITLERRTYGCQCFHKFGKIVESVCVASATRFQPAEYLSTAECLVCGDRVDPSDIQNLIE
jgi:hypothetical protein